MRGGVSLAHPSLLRRNSRDYGPPEPATTTLPCCHCTVPCPLSPATCTFQRPPSRPRPRPPFSLPASCTRRSCTHLRSAWTGTVGPPAEGCVVWSPVVSGGRTAREDNAVLGGARMGTGVPLRSMASVYSQPRLRRRRCAALRLQPLGSISKCLNTPLTLGGAIKRTGTG